MKVILREGFEYIPVWNGNKDVPKKEQIVVKFKFLCGGDLVECFTNGKPDAFKEWMIICESVTNLKVGNTEVTPEGIYKINGLAALYTELKLMYAEESEFDRKK